MTKFLLASKLNKAMLVSEEDRYAFENNKKTDRIEGTTLVCVPLESLAETVGSSRMIKIKLPNKESKVLGPQVIELVNLKVSPYVSSRSRYVQYSFSADGFRPIGSDEMSSEGDEE